MAGELIDVTLAFLSGDVIKLSIPNISAISEIMYALYHKRGLTSFKYDLVINNTVHEYYNALMNIYDYGIRDGDVIPVIIRKS